MYFNSLKEMHEHFAKEREAEEKAKKPAPKKTPAKEAEEK
jgi:hypothetical protein